MSGNPIRGGMFSAMVLRLTEAEPHRLEETVAGQVAVSPGFYHNAPLLFDLDGTSSLPESDEDFAALIALARKYGLQPVGIKGGSAKQKAEALRAQLPAFTSSPQEAAKKDNNAAIKTRVIDQPVRSGVQIYARGGDLIVLSAVSSGAEVIADGNVHIYGTLRGRAIAGASGDGEARIFCRSLHAEMLAIAGRYLVSEGIEAAWRGKPVAVNLVNEQLRVELL